MFGTYLKVYKKIYKMLWICKLIYLNKSFHLCKPTTCMTMSAPVAFEQGCIYFFVVPRLLWNRTSGSSNGEGAPSLILHSDIYRIGQQLHRTSAVMQKYFDALPVFHTIPTLLYEQNVNTSQFFLIFLFECNID